MPHGHGAGVARTGNNRRPNCGGSRPASENDQRNAPGARTYRHAQPVRAERTVDFRRYGLLLDPYQQRLSVPRHRGNQLERLHLPRQPDDRLRLPGQHGPRRTLHLFAHAAQAGQRRTAFRQRGDGHEHRGQGFLLAQADLFGGGDLAAVHPAGTQQTLRAVQRDVARGRRHAGALRQRLAREGNLRNRLHPFAGHFRRAS